MCFLLPSAVFSHSELNMQTKKGLRHTFSLLFRLTPLKNSRLGLHTPERSERSQARGKESGRQVQTVCTCVEPPACPPRRWLSFVACGPGSILKGSWACVPCMGVFPCNSTGLLQISLTGSLALVNHKHTSAPKGSAEVLDPDNQVSQQNRDPDSHLAPSSCSSGVCLLSLLVRWSGDQRSDGSAKKTVPGPRLAVSPATTVPHSCLPTARKAGK